MSGVGLVEFLREAVAIDSSADAAPMRRYLCATLEAAGIPVEVTETGTVLAQRGPAGAPTHLLLNTHLDTVPPHIPPRWDPETQVLHGRGSADAKGPLAAMVDAFTAAALPPDARVTLAVTSDEEADSHGAAALDVGQTMAIVGEPTDLTLATAAKGRFVAAVRLEGTAGHAATPAECVNPIEAVGPAVSAIHEMDASTEPDPLLGPPVATVTQVAATGPINQVPATVELMVDRRSIPPETAGAFEQRLQGAVSAAVPTAVTVRAALVERPTPFLTAFRTPESAHLVGLLQEAVGAAGIDPAVTAFAAATEASYFADTPVVVFGPGRLVDADGPIAHAEREYVHTPAVETAAVVLRETIESLGPPG
jgi:Acetylornithine deacetylase/Succinyl-diaminopimelate desuccinylase and related deacylases